MRRKIRRSEKTENNQKTEPEEFNGFEIVKSQKTLEGESEKGGLLMGYTDTMKLVNVKADKKYIGKIVNVKINDIKTWSMDGEIVE